MSSLKMESVTFCSCCTLQFCSQIAASDCLHLFLFPLRCGCTASLQEPKRRRIAILSSAKPGLAACLPHRLAVAGGYVMRAFCLAFARSAGFAGFVRWPEQADEPLMGDFVGSRKEVGCKGESWALLQSALLPGLVIFLGLIYVDHEVS
jgi:hypothetical protein